MKRLILFSFALVVTMMSWADMAEVADFRVVCKDGSIAYFSGLDTEMSFNEDATLLYVTRGAHSATYAIDGVESVEFAQSGAYKGKYSYDGLQVDVVIDPADDTSYTTVNEEKITDEKHDCYGDFEEYIVNTTVKIEYKDGLVLVNDEVVNLVALVGVASSPQAIISVDGSHVTVRALSSKMGYTLKGSTINGSFKLYSEKKTRITLDGVSITNPTGPAINIQSGKTMFVELVDGTTNYLEDANKEYEFTEEELEGGEDGKAEQKKGAFFSEGQLVFSGKGSLNVKSYHKHGIASDDYVRIRDGHFTINAGSDGISTKDYFFMYGGELAINAGKDGIDVGEGYIEIGAGKLNIQAGDEGIAASYEGDEDTGVIDDNISPDINIKGGLIKVATTGDKGHALRAMSTISMTGGIVQATTKGAGSKALMSEGDMSLTGGKITAFTEGGALYEEGELSSSAGVRSKGALTIENMIVGVKSTGTGGKGINNVGDVALKNSRVTVVASGATHESDGLDSRSRGVTTDGNLTVDKGSLLVRSFDAPLYLDGTSAFLNNAVYGGYQVGND